MDSAGTRGFSTLATMSCPSPATPHQVSGVAFGPDGKTIASASSEGTVRLWEASTGKPIGRPATGHADFVNGVAFGADGKAIASASSDGTVRLWGTSTRQTIGHAPTGHLGFLKLV